jgi:hypothetical protein
MRYDHLYISGYGYPYCLFDCIDDVRYFSVWLDR